jgi:hypothetical protein
MIIVKEKVNKSSWKYQILLILLIPLFAPILVYKLKMYGYSVEEGATTICFVASVERHNDILAIYFPAVVIILFALVLGVTVIISVSWNLSRRQFISLRRSIASSMVVHPDTEVTDPWLYRTFPGIVARFKIPLLVLLTIVLSLFMLLYTRTIRALESDRIARWKAQWISCVFQYYDGSSDLSWESRCGSHPPRAFGMMEKYWNFITLAGFSIVISIVCIPNILLNVLMKNIYPHVSILISQIRRRSKNGRRRRISHTQGESAPILFQD